MFMLSSRRRRGKTFRRLDEQGPRWQWAASASGHHPAVGGRAQSCRPRMPVEGPLLSSSQAIFIHDVSRSRRTRNDRQIYGREVGRLSGRSRNM